MPAHTKVAVHMRQCLSSFVFSKLRGCNYPARMRRGKVIGRVIVVVVDTKIAKSGDVRTWASCKHNEYVKFGEKTGFSMLRIECHSLRESQIVYFSWPL